MLIFADVILAVILLSAPFLYAAVDLPVQAGLGILSVILLNLVYFSRPEALRAVVRGGLARLGLGMGFFILLQLVPLPIECLKVLSWNTYHFYNQFHPDILAVRGFLPVSVYPYDTLCALIQFATYGCVFIATLMRLEPAIGQQDNSQNLSFRKNNYLILGCLTGVLALVFHSLYDFNLHITANGIYFVFLLALAIGASGKAYDDKFFRRGINLVIVTGFLVALFAIIQKLSFNGRIYWIGRVAKGAVGPYFNYDHFAGFMALCSGPAVAMSVASIFHSSFFHCNGITRKMLWFSSAEAHRALRFFFMSAVMISTIFLSTSRGGIMSFALSLLIFFVFVFMAARKTGKAGRFWVIFLAVILMAGIVVVWVGPQDVLTRFHLTSIDKIIKMESPDSVRIMFYKDTLDVIRDFPTVGTGLGTFGTNFTRYRTFTFTMDYLRYVHNDYLHLVAETGIAGSIFIAGFLVIFTGMIIRISRRLA